MKIVKVTCERCFENYFNWNLCLSSYKVPSNNFKGYNRDYLSLLNSQSLSIFNRLVWKVNKGLQVLLDPLSARRLLFAKSI